MSRRNFNDGQEIVYEDLNKISYALERTMIEDVVHQIMQRTENAFFDDSCLVEYASATAVTIRAGLGIQTDNTQTSPQSKKRLIKQATQTTSNLAAPDGTNPRIDLICVKSDIITELTETRKFKNASTSVITNESLVTQKDWSIAISVVQGTPAGSPSAPAIPSGYIKIAELYVTAVTGLSGAGAVTDTRTVMPLNNMYRDFEEQATAPGTPPSGFGRIYYLGGAWYTKDDGGNLSLLGAGGGGGSAGKWYELSGSAPILEEEFSNEVYKFEAGLTQKLIMWVKVPDSYVAGRQIKMFGSQYSPSTSNNMLLRTVATLVRKNTDAADSTTNQRTSTNAALTNTVANQYRESEFDLTSSTGQINSVSVTAGDLIKIELSRGSDTDTNDVRFIPNATQLKFG